MHGHGWVVAQLLTLIGEEPDFLDAFAVLLKRLRAEQLVLERGADPWPGKLEPPLPPNDPRHRPLRHQIHGAAEERLPLLGLQDPTRRLPRKVLRRFAPLVRRFSP